MPQISREKEGGAHLTNVSVSLTSCTSLKGCASSSAAARGSRFLPKPLEAAMMWLNPRLQGGARSDVPENRILEACRLRQRFRALTLTLNPNPKPIKKHFSGSREDVPAFRTCGYWSCEKGRLLTQNRMSQRVSHEQPRCGLEHAGWTDGAKLKGSGAYKGSGTARPFTSRAARARGLRADAGVPLACWEKSNSAFA